MNKCGEIGFVVGHLHIGGNSPPLRLMGGIPSLGLILTNFISFLFEHWGGGGGGGGGISHYPMKPGPSLWEVCLKPLPFSVYPEADGCSIFSVTTLSSII